jgi:hypothetical protein
VATDKELEQGLVDLGHEVERLRVRFQQYFMGIDKKPPNVQRDQLERRIRESPLNEVRRANLKFRFTSLIQKYRTYEVFWDRILREIEEGRFNRDVFDRDMSAKGRRGDRAAAGRAAPGKPTETGDQAHQPARAEPAAAGEAPEPAKPAKPTKPATPGPIEPSPVEDPDRRLFLSWMNARVTLGMSVEGITEAAFRAGLERQRRIQSEKLGVEDVTFEVAVKEGKVVLLARPVSGAR